MSTDRNKDSLGPEWSQTVNSLSGRLLVRFEDLKPGLRHSIYLELRNHALAPIVVSNLPEFHAQLFDSSRMPVSESGFSSNGPSPILQWAAIPRDAYVGLRVDLQTIGVPTREHKRVLLAFGNTPWELSVGQYVLEATAVFNREDGGPPNQWTGELKLPPVEVVVTDDMFSE